MTKKAFFRIYKILLSISIIIAGCCLIAGSLYIFFSGGTYPYSRQIVADTFLKICVPIYISLALIVGSFILNKVIPCDTKSKPEKNYQQIINNLIRIKDTKECIEYKKSQKRITIIKIINLSILSLCSVVFLTYALNPNNFYLLEDNGSFDFNSAMINAMWIFLPCLTSAFVSSVVTHYINISIIKRQINILKTLPNKEPTSKTLTDNNKKILVIKIVILIIGIAFLLFGALTGGFNDVLTKAVQICTECIGLG